MLDCEGAACVRDSPAALHLPEGHAAVQRLQVFLDDALAELRFKNWPSAY